MCNKSQPSPMNRRMSYRGPVRRPLLQPNLGQSSLHSDTVTFWKRNWQHPLWSGTTANRRSSVTENSITSEEIVLRSEQRRRRHTISFGYMTVGIICTPAGQNFHMNTLKKSAPPQIRKNTLTAPFSHAAPTARAVDGLFCGQLRSTHATAPTSSAHFKSCDMSRVPLSHWSRDSDNITFITNRV